MKLSTRTRYGIRAMLELALNHGNGPMRLKVIAQRQDISVKYLEQLIAILRQTGFVKSLRGPKGGYILAKSPDQIKLSECFAALEGLTIGVECLEDKTSCARIGDCIARSLWDQVQQAMMGVLESVTLKDLIDRASNEKTLNYHI